MSPAKQMTRRARLIDEVSQAARANSTATVLMHTAVAERLGLNPGDYKALDVIQRFGPVTPGQLVERTGLTSPSVTALIDRLEEKGFVRRLRDMEDRRRVLVQVDPEGLARVIRAFTPFVRLLPEFWESFTTDQLDVIRDFLIRSADLAHRATSAISARDESR
jgi:DNA-binding MarR family transcriptional regulator